MIDSESPWGRRPKVTGPPTSTDVLSGVKDVRFNVIETEPILGVVQHLHESGETTVVHHPLPWQPSR
jgi:hypothetical protein